MTGKAKGATHREDAEIAVRAFEQALPDPRSSSTITAERPLSLLGAAVLWSGLSDNLDLLRTECLVINPADA